jgi:hypothetical protein
MIKKDIVGFLITYIKCLLVLIVLGYLLPMFFDYLLFYFYKRKVIYKNSIFVIDIHNNINIFQYYYNAFRSYITY